MNSKLRILSVVLIVLGLLGWWAVDGLRQIGVNQGYEPDQPIAFSHKIHAGDNSINCEYCHFGAENSRHAGIPPASVCMNCHAQIRKDSPEIAKVVQALQQNNPIEWIKVHRLADFVYFNHAQHVAVGKVPCQTCHGPVETMTRIRQEQDLSMGWCLDCHRKSDVKIAEHSPGMKVGDMGGQDCAKCHY